LAAAPKGSAITFTATVANILGGPTPTGYVTFYNRSSGLATVPLTNGVATYTTSTLPAGNHSFLAAYEGGVNLAPSLSNTVSQAVRAGLSIFAVGGTPGRVQVRHVLDGSLITDFAPHSGYTGPVSVALGDINNDGFQDLITATRSGKSQIHAYDGKGFGQGNFDPDDDLLAQWFAFGPNGNVGVNLAVGDINNDGLAEVVAGAVAGNPRVLAYNGAGIAAGTANALADFFAYGLNFNIGANVAVGDLTGDGFADIITGASAGNPDVRVFTGRDVATGIFKADGASRIASWFAYGLNFNVGATVSTGDVNGDGFIDVITGATVGNPHVRIFSGKDVASGAVSTAGPGPTELGQFFAYQLQFNVGARVAAADFDGDGKADLLTGASAGSPHYRVVKSTAGGIVPPALKGIEGIPADWLGGINVSA
jgi:hypothetical protein